jgi:hypothetical protein
LEDASVWLPDALSRDPIDALFTSFNGYLQLLSRLVAEPVAALPVEAYAPAMAIAGAAIVAASACLVWRASAGYFENVYLRVALVAVVILLPVVGTESLATVTNSIWFVLYACMWALLWRPHGRGEAAVAAGAGGAVAGQQVNGELWELGGELWIVALAVGLLALLWATFRDSRTRLLVPLLVPEAPSPGPSGLRRRRPNALLRRRPSRSRSQPAACSIPDHGALRGAPLGRVRARHPRPL